MTFESMSNLDAQREYDVALKALDDATEDKCREEAYNKAITALMKLYPQWKQFEREQCLNEDIKETKEQSASEACSCCECDPCDCDWGME